MARGGSTSPSAGNSTPEGTAGQRRHRRNCLIPRRRRSAGARRKGGSAARASSRARAPVGSSTAPSSRQYIGRNSERCVNSQQRRPRGLVARAPRTAGRSLSTAARALCNGALLRQIQSSSAVAEPHQSVHARGWMFLVLLRSQLSSRWTGAKKPLKLRWRSRGVLGTWLPALEAPGFIHPRGARHQGQLLQTPGLLRQPAVQHIVPAIPLTAAPCSLNVPARPMLTMLCTAPWSTRSEGLVSSAQ